MINYREIFNMNNSYIGLIIIIVLILFIFLLDRDGYLRLIGKSCLISGVVMGLMYIVGNILVNSFRYNFFIKVITDNFFNSIIIFSVSSFILGIVGLILYKCFYKEVEG